MLLIVKTSYKPPELSTNTNYDHVTLCTLGVIGIVGESFKR